MDHAIEGAIDRAHANLFLGFPDTPSGRSEVVALLRSFGDSGWVIDAMRALGGEPEIQEDLARALGAENAAIATLLAVAVSIELDDVDAATRQLFQADSLRHVAVAHLEAIEGPALMSTFITERAVSATAEVAGQLVRWWIVAGVVAWRGACFEL